MKRSVSAFILSYLRFFARVKLARQHAWVLGVTGSIGKSSFVSLFTAVAGAVYSVKATAKGNSETGLPLEILGLRARLSDYSAFSWFTILLRAPFAAFYREDWNFLVAEMGIDSPFPPKNMDYLLSIVRPDIGVLLNVAAVHTEQFADALPKEKRGDEPALLAIIAGEKGKLLKSLSASQIAIVNGDQEELAPVRNGIRAHTMTFGSSEGVDVRLVSHKTAIHDGTTFRFSAGGKEYPCRFPSQILFPEYGRTIAAVLAAAHAVHIPYRQAIERITHLGSLPPGRFSVFAGKHESVIFDSSYNASPDAMRAALSFLSGQTGGKRIAVLGDMRELGKLAEKKHREIVAMAADCADIIILVGPLLREYGIRQLHDRKFPRDRQFWFPISKGVGEFLDRKFLSRGDSVLVKGSQNTIFLETAVAELLSHPEDKAKLCRQSPYWDEVRERFFQEYA